MRAGSVIAMLLGVAAGAGGGSLTAQQQLIPGGHVREGTLSFDGHATTGDFVGSTSSVSGEMHGGPSLTEVRGSVEARVATLKTGNGHRDRDLNSSLESGPFPTMRYELTGVVPGPAVEGGQRVTLVGRLTIHGVTRDEQLTAILHPLPNAVRVTTSFQLDLADYHIGGLTKMLGILRMDRQIQVHVDVTFGAT
jgi:polyisoprenoid-binding protein YceI